ncbi:MAG: UvrD-helicase domain-containing protein [Trueperaceae bacterium]|nr:MAG: UvrD-helicase domain-containing protein [Trueperaceae bacterium]
MKVRVASAGTGKTTSLVQRYLELIGSGIPLRRVAGVTFTRTAADELRQRVAAGVKELLENGDFLDGSYVLDEVMRPSFGEAVRELDGATLSTIHGFMVASLRLVAPMMGLDPDFSVLGEWEAQAMFEEEVKSVLYLAEDAGHGLATSRRLLGDEALPMLLTLFGQRSLTEAFESEDHPMNSALVKLFDAAYKRFELRLGSQLLPPSEVERRALKLVRNGKALARLRERFRLVLVDEFQDVNPLQGHFFEQLERGGVQIEVVGDPKQSIYGFRNADVEVFRRAMREGEELPALDRTWRHARVVARFLNHMTRTLAAEEMGFGRREAPEVEASGAQREVAGRVEIHWVTDDAPIAELRTTEARVLASRLRELHETYGYAYSDMAVLARSYAGLSQVEEALRADDLPYVLLQGRGYYERLEIRDLYHALHVGIDPSGLSLGVWLRSPFAQLDLKATAAVLAADDPLDALKVHHPEVADRLELIREGVRATPLSALKLLIREPFIAGRRYVDFLDTRARENVDALLFTVARQPPGDIEILLDRLELLSRQTDAGDVPQSGEGIQLLTVHRAKGLEWPLVAVFDLGRMNYHHPQKLYLSPENGFVYHAESSGFEAARRAIKTREEAESFRLFYVAASRARDVLVMTGSIKRDKLEGWSKALAVMKLGPEMAPIDQTGFCLKRYPNQSITSESPIPALKEAVTPAPWIDRSFPRNQHPPVQSPSRLKEEHDVSTEPLPFSDPEEGERLPGRSSTVGTLVHYAISQNWRAGDPTHLENLRAQEVMFPYTSEEQQDILAEVAELLGSYQSLLGKTLPGLGARDEDYPELAMALSHQSTVWQGIIDRLYCVGDTWYLEDYKTDQEVVPSRYHFQLAVYWKAVQEVRGIQPEVRLVFLRHARVEVIDPEALEEAFSQVAS